MLPATPPLLPGLPLLIAARVSFGRGFRARALCISRKRSQWYWRELLPRRGAGYAPVLRPLGSADGLHIAVFFAPRFHTTPTSAAFRHPARSMRLLCRPQEQIDVSADSVVATGGRFHPNGFSSVDHASSHGQQRSQKVSRTPTPASTRIERQHASIGRIPVQRASRRYSTTRLRGQQRPVVAPVPRSEQGSPACNGRVCCRSH